jgi:hypothetical protein
MKAAKKASKNTRDGYELSQYWAPEIATRTTRSHDVTALAGYKRAISNFVRIVTGKNIPVVFATKGDSYTNGKYIVLSSKLEQKEFDVTVGLALHEGSHIAYTDMPAISLEHQRKVILSDFEFVTAYNLKHKCSGGIGLAVDKILRDGHLKDLINIIEDRRVDYIVFKNAPGYRGYYHALYGKYFWSSVIGDGLKSSHLRTEDWESYLFRINNIVNVNSDLNALEKLQVVYDMLDLSNISRLENTYQVVELAYEIFKVIENNIPVDLVPESKNVTDNSKQQDHNGLVDAIQTLNDIPYINPEDQFEQDDSDDTLDDDIDDDSDDTLDDDSDDDTIDPKLLKAIQEQNNVIRGEIRKKTISRNIGTVINTVSESDVIISKQEFDTGLNKTSTVDVLIIDNITENFMDTVQCDMWCSRQQFEQLKVSTRYKFRGDYVSEAIRMGTKLGRKLKVRQEQQTTKFIRQRSGVIDRRMLAGISYDMETIFTRMQVSKYDPALIHISIDTSGSMGSNVYKVFMTATAIAKACSMIQDIQCIIDVRCQCMFEGISRPIVCTVYNSEKDPFVKLTKLLPRFQSAGGTPEGLCFSAMLPKLVSKSRTKDVYFVNFSDGMPQSQGYNGRAAVNHTKKVINAYRKNNINVLSYFIRNQETYGLVSSDFQYMYGRDAHHINIKDVTQVAHTMNKKMLQTSNHS